MSAIGPTRTLVAKLPGEYLEVVAVWKGSTVGGDTVTPRWACSLGHRVEAETEEELVRKVQEHMRRDHGMEISPERILRDLREED